MRHRGLAIAGLVLAAALPGQPASAGADRLQARADSDHDGLSNVFERTQSRTNPRRRDTDRDRLSDGFEVRRSRTNPRSADTDGDGLNDRDEKRRFGTNPLKADSDGDGLGDGSEVLLGYNPLDPGSPAPAEGTPPPPPPPPPSGAGVFLSPTGSDAGACSKAAPCRTLNRGYVVAQPGQTVELAAGSYGNQTINRDASKTSTADVVFRPAGGATVTLGSVTSYGSHLTLEDMNASDLTARVSDPPTYTVSDVTFRNMDARNFMSLSASDFNVLGGDYGPASACGGAYGGSNSSIRRLTVAGAPVPQNVLIDGVRIHDVVSHDFNACHIEGLAIFAGDGVTVRDSRFWGNSVYDIFLQPNSGAVSNVTLENNWFAAPVGEGGSGGGSSAVAFSGNSSAFANTLIRHNSFNAQLALDDNGLSPSYSNFRVVGNVGDLAWGDCELALIISHNVWRNEACDSSDRNLGGGAYPFVSAQNGSGMDYHLTGGVARDLVPDSVSTLSDDIDGEARPMGGRRDAGADEMG
jgi:Bacterial TSP3 repeat